MKISVPIRFLAMLLALLLASQAFAAGVDFTLTGLDGRKHRLSDYRGKWVVVNYWATWCPPCLEEVPELVMFHDKHKDKDAVVLGVNMEDISTHDLTQFVEDNMVSYPVLRNEPGMIALGPLPGLPVTYLVSPEGRVVAHTLGGVTAEEIESAIAAEQGRR